MAEQTEKAFLKQPRVFLSIPIEQRWSACSRSAMSPASSSAEDYILMGWYNHVPSYSGCTPEKGNNRRILPLPGKVVGSLFSAFEHWAKIEVPKDKEEVTALQSRLRKHFPVDAYNKF